MSIVYRSVIDVGNDAELHVVRLKPYDDDGVEKEQYVDYDGGNVQAIVFSLYDDGQWRADERFWYQERGLKLSKTRFDRVKDLIDYFSRPTAPIPYQPREEESRTYDGEVVLTDQEQDQINQKWTAIVVISALVFGFAMALYLLS